MRPYTKIEIEDISNKSDILKLIQNSIKQSCQVEFFYKGKFRFIKPYNITTFDGYWYLYGCDILEDKLKTFYIKDIEKLIVSDKIFEKDIMAFSKLENAVNVWFEPNNEYFEVKLLAKSEISKYFLRRPLSKNQKVLEYLENGDILFSLEITSEKEIIHEVKKWLPYLVVIEPKSLSKQIFDLSKEFLDIQLEYL